MTLARFLLLVGIGLSAVLHRLSHAATQNLLTNGGFEESKDHWDCWDYSCDLTTVSHSGKKALKVTGRTNYWQGPSQSVNLGLGKRYSVEGWIRLTNHNDKFLQYIEIEIEVDHDNGKKDYMSVARHSFITPQSGWVQLAGDFVSPSSGMKSAKVYLQGPDPGIDFLVDDMSLSEIVPDTHWKTKANSRIDKLRKSDMHFHVTTAPGINASSVLLIINQTSHSFPFGMAIDANKITSSQLNYRKYSQFVYDNFNWVTPGNALKWYEFERVRGQPNWNWGESAVKEMRKNGMKVRGHNMLWAVEQFVPGWLKNLGNAEVREAVAKHVKETTLRYKGLVEHWDVNNELLHGNWFESKLNDTDYTQEVFRMMHKWDPNVKLFLNEYNTVGSGGSTGAYAQQGADYKRSNTHIYGMGVQSHFPGEVAPDPTLVMSRLDRLSKVGLPLWCTELTVSTADVNKRAEWYDTAYRVLFSHPAVEGIIMWGYWNERGSGGSGGSLVDGQAFKINAAGKKYLNLVHTEWRTHETHALSSGKSFTVRGFHGNYDIVVIVGGDVIQTKQITLGKTAQNVNIHVNTS